MDFRLLGDVEVWHGGRQLGLGSRQRAVLAVLLHRANTVVPRSEIVRLAWGGGAGEVPATVDDLVADYVSRLRTVVRRAGAGDELRLVARSPGYLVCLDPEAVDWLRFCSLLGQARLAREAGDLDDAVRLLARGLDQWRGPALADLASPSLGPIREQMDDQRLAAVEELATIEVGRGAADRVIDLLTDLARYHPARERLAALRIQALNAIGRRDEAIVVYQRTRRHLSSELGLDPSEVLDQAYHGVLTGEKPATAELATRPAQLPRDTSNFTGRAGELDQLLAMASDASGSRAPGVVVICAVDGMAGMGKTALAVHAAHRMASQFPDGALFIDLHGYTDGIPPVEPVQALDRLLRALGVAGNKIPPHVDDCAALYRDRLADKRMLILLDNARQADQVQPLLPAGSGCIVLVTSRQRLTGLDDAHLLSLDLLPLADAAALFTRVAGPGRTAECHNRVEHIVELCGRLPLAIRIAAARLRGHRAWTPSAFAERLTVEHRRLKELDDGERSIGAAFDLSYRGLTPQHQRMFRLLGLLPGRDVDSYAAAALASTTVDHAEPILADLLDAHLLVQRVEGRYEFHDLMRTYAAVLANREDSAAARQAACTRLFDNYLHTAAHAMDLAFPHERHRRPSNLGPNAPIERLSTPGQAMTWLDTELSNLLAAGTYSAAHGWPDHTTQLAATLWRYLDTRARHGDAITLHTAALQAARHHGRRADEGAACHNLGTSYWRSGHYDTALDHLTRALTIRSEIKDLPGEAATLNVVGNIDWFSGRYTSAVKRYTQALAIQRGLDKRAFEGTILGNLAGVLFDSGDYSQAVDHVEEALSIHRQFGYRLGQAIDLLVLGAAFSRLGRCGEALIELGQALTAFREVDDRTGEGWALAFIGRAYERQGRYEEALDHLKEALNVHRDVGDQNMHGRTLTALGVIQLRLGRLPDALDNFKQSLRVSRATGCRGVETEALNRLGAALRAMEQHQEALTHHIEAHVIACEVNDRYEQAYALDGIAAVLFTTGRPSEARQQWTCALAIYTKIGVPEANEIESQLASIDTYSGNHS